MKINNERGRVPDDIEAERCTAAAQAERYCAGGGRLWRGTHGEFPWDDGMAVSGTISSTDSTGVVPSGNAGTPDEFRILRGLTGTVPPEQPKHGKSKE